MCWIDAPCTTSLCLLCGSPSQFVYSPGVKPVLQIKNGQNVSALLQAYVRDKRDNAHDTLPDGVDLEEAPPTLQVYTLT